MSIADLPISERIRFRGDLEKLRDRAKKIRKVQAASSKQDVMAKADDLLAGAERIGGTAIIVAQMGQAPIDQLRQACDSLRARAESAAILLAAEQAGKVILLAAMTKDLAGKGVKAGDLIKAIAPTVGGKGGGRPDMAQGGGPDLAKVPDAVREAGEWLRAKLGG
jgi:alanyl-tRNA synthetase